MINKERAEWEQGQLDADWHNGFLPYWEVTKHTQDFAHLWSNEMIVDLVNMLLAELRRRRAQVARNEANLARIRHFAGIKEEAWSQ